MYSYYVRVNSLAYIRRIPVVYPGYICIIRISPKLPLACPLHGAWWRTARSPSEVEGLCFRLQVSCKTSPLGGHVRLRLSICVLRVGKGGLQLFHKFGKRATGGGKIGSSEPDTGLFHCIFQEKEENQGTSSSIITLMVWGFRIRKTMETTTTRLAPALSLRAAVVIMQDVCICSIDVCPLQRRQRERYRYMPAVYMSVYCTLQRRQR